MTLSSKHTPPRPTRGREIPGQVALIVLGLLLLAGCDGAELPLMPLTPAALVSDGAHGGTGGFYFLSPLMSDPVTSGSFDPALSPAVRICALAGTDCGVTIASFDANTSPAVTVDTKEESYSVLWKTKDLNLDPSVTYRMEVRVASVLLGFADIDVVLSAGELKQVASGYVGLVAGRPLAIRFRIETGIIGQVVVSPASAIIGTGASQQLTATFLDLHGSAVAAPAGVVWSSSDATVADVSATGLANGTAAGETDITAAFGQVSGSATLLVVGEFLFRSDRSGDLHLYLQAPGGTATLLTAGLAFSGTPVWAPDGNRIALQLGGSVNVLPLGGSPVPVAEGHSPAWSPDGTRIAFVYNAGHALSGNEIWVVNANGTGSLELTSTNDNDLQPSWSPVGDWIAFVRPRDVQLGVYVIRPDGTALNRISGHIITLSIPAWSPDGLRIAYTGRPTLLGGLYEDDLYVAMADGTAVVQLTDTPGVEERAARWSPDGSRIAFLRQTAVMGTTDIWLMNADGSGVTNLTNHAATYSGPFWSADGRAIGFSSDRDGNFEIYVIRADGSALLRVTDNSAADWFYGWRPRP